MLTDDGRGCDANPGGLLMTSTPRSTYMACDRHPGIVGRVVYAVVAAERDAASMK